MIYFQDLVLNLNQPKAILADSQWPYLSYKSHMGAHWLRDNFTGARILKDNLSTSTKIPRTKSFLIWYKSGDGLPIYDISVVHGDDDPPVNFIKLDYDLAKGQSKASFLCIKRCTTESQRAINSMKIVANGNKNGLQGYEQVDLSLSPTAPVYLFYQRQSQEQAEAHKWSGVDLNIGDWVDCINQVNAWCKAKVVDANASEVRVNYSGWSSRWDQWIVRHSTRLAEANTRTKGIDTG